MILVLNSFEHFIFKSIKRANLGFISPGYGRFLASNGRECRLSEDYSFLALKCFFRKVFTTRANYVGR